MIDLLARHDLILMEAAVVERLRRNPGVSLHPVLEHALLIYDRNGRGQLQTIYYDYITVAKEAGLPLLLCTPTWRANKERLKRTGVSQDVNYYSVRFMQSIREEQGDFSDMIRIGGFVGCKNDCYKPEEGLSTKEAEEFHSWQINQLAKAEPDFLMAGTLPNINEARGIVRAMQRTGTPYIISFVINRKGHLLDGTSLAEAVNSIDEETEYPPLCYMVNCSYPTFLNAQKQPLELFTRLLGFQANASDLDHSELNGSARLHAVDIADWGNEMLTLNRNHGIRILGGCCGTDGRHLRYLAKSRIA